MTLAVLQASVLQTNGALSVAAGAQITVRTPAGALAALYTDRSGTTPAGNPFTADSNGFFRVYVAPGRYDVTVLTDVGTQVYKDIALFAEGNVVAAMVDNIADLRALPSYSSQDGMSVQLRGYYTPGDGGGGPLRIWKGGAAPGTYVDNGGSIIVPTGGDGSGAWVWEYSGAVNVKWFGAKGDGVADDQPSIQAALTSSSNIFIPEGDYRINTSVTSSGKSLSIKGDSFATTRILCVAGGLAFTLTPQVVGAPPDQAHVSDLTIQTIGTVATPALQLEWSAYQPNAQGQFTVDKVNIVRNDDGLGSFTSGIRLVNAIVGSVSNCFMVGDDARVSNIGIDLVDCVGVRIDKCDINRFKTGVSITKVSAVQSEGIFIADSFIYDVFKGVTVNTAIHVNLINTHININGASAEYAVRLENTNQCAISAGCLLYFGGSVGDAALQDCVQIIGSNGASITSSYIVGVTPANTRYGISLSGGSGLSIISGCTISSCSAEGVFFGSIADNYNILTGCIFFGNTSDYTDSGTNNYISNNTDEAGKTVGNLRWGDNTGKFSSGEISSNANWGAFIKGHAGTAADVALVTSNNIAVVKLDTANNLVLTIPTSSTGLPVGAVWNNAGVLNIA